MAPAAKSDPGYEYVWGDERYRFANIERRDMFKVSLIETRHNTPSGNVARERSKGGARSRESARP
jgi:hypothetical protein